MTQTKDCEEQLTAELSHRTFVKKILNSYKKRDIVPGDPNEGTWHQAHFPLPNHLGGQTVVLLLREHHAIQGVLQSEEFQSCCLYGWEKEYLTGELLERWKHWMRVKAEKGWEAARKSSIETHRRLGIGFFNPDLQQRNGKKTNGKLPSRLAGLKKGRTPEHQSKAGKRGGIRNGKPLLFTRQGDGHVFYFDSASQASKNLKLNIHGICRHKDSVKPYHGFIINSFS